MQYVCVVFNKDINVVGNVLGRVYYIPDWSLLDQHDAAHHVSTARCYGKFFFSKLSKTIAVAYFDY